MKIKLQDVNFYGDDSSSKMHKPKHFEWDRKPGQGALVFFTDKCLHMADLPCYKDAKKVAWLVEPYPINPYCYNYAFKNKDKYDLILSHNIGFVEKLPSKATFYPNGMSHIKDEDWKKYPKSKLASIIVSNKRLTPDHEIRHRVVNEIKQQKLPIDLYGTGYNYVEYKLDALKDYMFSVVLENCSIDSYFSEKILDCFATHTMPVYKGCGAITDFFNPEGIIRVDSFEDIMSGINLICSDGYEIYHQEQAQKAMTDNFELAKRYKTAEDYIFEKILKPKGLV